MIRLGRKIVFLCMISLTLLTACFSADANSDSVSLDQARQMLESKSAVVIDIRESQEHQNGVAFGMQLLPMSQLSQRMSELPTSKQQTILLVCNTQNRSPKVQQILRENGYQNVKWVQGGMSEWRKRNWPLLSPS